MCQKIDYSIFDRPEFLRLAFYPREEYVEGPFNARDVSVQVDDGVSISCRHYVKARAAPTILFFHGNGEVVSEYDEIAPLFNDMGANLLVADYRGYGASGGAPTFATMIADAEAIFHHTREMMRRDGFTDALFVMGRSLGSLSVLDLACRHEAELKGLIIESGFASPTRLLRHIGGGADRAGFEEADTAATANLKAIKIPTLIIHGEHDDLIPLEEGKHLYANIGAADKRLVVIPGAGHNDVMFLGRELYFQALSEFLASR